MPEENLTNGCLSCIARGDGAFGPACRPMERILGRTPYHLILMPGFSENPSTGRSYSLTSRDGAFITDHTTPCLLKTADITQKISTRSELSPPETKKVTPGFWGELLSR